MLVDLYGLPKETRYCVIPVKKMIMRGGSSLYLSKSNIFHSLKTSKNLASGTVFHKKIVV